jgi:hypothetical protein
MKEAKPGGGWGIGGQQTPSHYFEKLVNQKFKIQSDTWKNPK